MNPRPDADPKKAAAERIAYRVDAEQGHAEMLAKFSPLTAENAQEAIEWQTARIKELQDARGPREYV